ncbi:MAG: hypothetical protein JW840_10540 [Candidatus Thermoplasmatota archaeon]|nr:hypothetical protein [Candidatus Thermoplasmatota archaeon]
MKNTHEHIWVWVQDSLLYKAVYRLKDCSFIVYNDQDEVILRYTGVTPEQLEQLQRMFVRIGAKQLPNQAAPFTYL